MKLAVRPSLTICGILARAICLVPLLGLGGSVLAGDGWARKPYLEWTEDDALAILTNSPWSKTWAASAPRRVGGVGPSGMPAGATEDSGQHSNCCRTFGTGIGSSAADPRNTRDDGVAERSTGSHGSPEESFRVVWLSSMRVRQALYRLRLINGAERDPAAEVELALPADRIVLAVSGPSMRRFKGASLDALRPLTRLESKTNRERVAEFLAFVAPETRPDRLALFVFSRTVTGRPVFGQEDKEVVFSSGGGANRIHVAFELGDMTSDAMTDY
jgi:hypothetical protein